MAAPKPTTQISTSTPASPLRVASLILLPLLSIFGAFVTMTLGRTNGTFISITNLIAQPNALLPGTSTPLLRTYTNLKPLDHQLSILVTFFAPLVDGSDFKLMLFSIAAAGQFGGIWCLMMLESLRVGNKGKIISYVGTFGLLIQTITYAITTPFYLFLHTLTSVSPTRANLHVPTLDITLLPLSCFLGYIIPSLLMALPPSLISPATHQYFIAFWQPFPLWTVTIHTLLRTLTSTPTNLKPISPRKIYNLVLVFTTLAHAPIVIYTASQGIFNATMNPAFPDLEHRVGSLAEGVLIFLKWDIWTGGIAFLVWSVVGWWGVVRSGKERGLLGVKVLVVGLSSGLAGVVGLLLRERDAVVEGVDGAEGKVEAKKE